MVSILNSDAVVWRFTEVRDVDVRALRDYGIPGILLMENAGRNAAELLLSKIANLVSVPAVAPVQPAVGAEKRSMDVGRVAADIHTR